VKPTGGLRATPRLGSLQRAMSADDKKAAPEDDGNAAPQTSLAALAKLAKEKLGPEPDLATPAATRTFAAIVRDLKGMPELLVTREHTHRLRLGRRGKVGSLGLEFRPNIRAIELSYIGFPGADPTTIKMHRYTYAAPPGAHLPEANTPLGKWHRMDEGGELIADVQDGLARLYPELADRD